MYINDLKTIAHDILVGTTENPLWRNWGFSIELEEFAYKPSDNCDFCKSNSGKFYKTVCHCGTGYIRNVENAKLAICSSWSPSNGDFTFYCCEKCLDTLTQLVQNQDKDLLNHERLIKVIEELKLINK